MGAVSERVRNASAKCKVPLGVNLGKNKNSRVAENDYELGASYFAPHSDYLVINVQFDQRNYSYSWSENSEIFRSRHLTRPGCELFKQKRSS